MMLGKKKRIQNYLVDKQGDMSVFDIMAEELL